MEGILYLLSPPPAPSHAYTFLKERTAQAREGENILYISFQRGCAPLKPLLWEAGGKRTLTGGARGAEPRLVEGLQGDTSPCGGIQRGACPPFEEMTRENYPHARLTRPLPRGHAPRALSRPAPAAHTL